MAALHDALSRLANVEWDDVPQDNLGEYMTEAFTAADLICNSLPPIPESTSDTASKASPDDPNFAKSHQDIIASSVRPLPPPGHDDSLQKHWGKPIKFKPADNPLQVSVYKMAGHDRHGAWFARRSIHEGLGFDKWKRAFLREFPASMAVSGGPGAGAIRGLAADRRLERVQIPELGRLEVYQLSAQFPGPVTPRDFMAMLMSPNDEPTEGSGNHNEETGRRYMVVSKPVEHPDAPIRSGFVRGSYESVELIREIPLSPGSPSQIRGQSVDADQPSGQGVKSSEQKDPELNPVEWIMITRSDPGGGIPRFLVERGTPETMLTDVRKFFDWACGLDHVPDPDDDLEQQQANSPREAAGQELENREAGTAKDQHDTGQESPENDTLATKTNSTGEPHQGGIMNNLSKAIGAGFESYAPTSVSNMFRPTDEQNDSDLSSDTSSDISFMSAEELRRLSTAHEELPREAKQPVDSLSIASGDNTTTSKDDTNLGPHEKEVLKLAKKREKLEQQLAKKRVAEESKLKQAQEKDEGEASKQKAEIEKRLKKNEERHRREIEKLEAKKAKEARKAEEKRRKRDEQSKLSLVTRERDEFRSQGDILRRENETLRAQVAELQAQAQERTRSTKSTKSGVSVNSAESLSRMSDTSTTTSKRPG